MKDCDPHATVICADMDLTQHEIQSVIPADGVVAIGRHTWM